jgi:hypothetical protein
MGQSRLHWPRFKAAPGAIGCLGAAILRLSPQAAKGLAVSWPAAPAEQIGQVRTVRQPQLAKPARPHVTALSRVALWPEQGMRNIGPARATWPVNTAPSV